MTKSLVYTLKGGAGKTRIALTLAKITKSLIVTNDYSSSLGKYLGEKEFVRLRLGQDIPALKQNHRVVFDMGGYPDPRIMDIAKKVDVIIIPFFCEVDYLQSAVDTMRELETVNKNIILVHNKAKKENIEKTKKLFREIYKRNYPIFEISESAFVADILSRRKTVEERLPFLNGKPKESANKVKDQFRAITKELKSRESGILLEA